MISIGSVLMVLLGAVLTMLWLLRYKKTKARPYRNRSITMALVTILMIVLIVALAVAH